MRGLPTFVGVAALVLACRLFGSAWPLLVLVLWWSFDMRRSAR